VLPKKILTKFNGLGAKLPIALKVRER